MKCFSVLLFVCLKVIAACSISDLDNKLINAAKNGDNEGIETLIEKGANVHVVGAWKYTPLHWATYYGKTKAIKALIKNGANVNAVDYLKKTPLHCAAYYGHTEAVKTLIENGANVNAVDSLKYTPLHWATYNGYTEAIKTLTENGANWFAKNKYDQAPYHLTSKKDQNIFTDAYTTLIEKGAFKIANLQNYKINKEIIEATKKRIYDKIDRAISDLGSFNLIDQFNQIKQDSLKEFDEKKSGGNEISNSFREKLNVNLNDFQTSLASTLQIYAHCIREYSDSMQKSLDENDYYEQTEFEKLHKNTKNEAIVQFVTEAQIIGDISASILRHIKRAINEKFFNFQKINNEKRQKIIDNINSVFCDHIKIELKENITRYIENINLNLQSNDLDNFFKRSKEAAMNEFDMKKAGNEDISKSFREKLETDLNNFRNDLFETMAKHQNYLDQYSNVMGNAINSSTSFLNENQLMDTHKRAKNESISEFLFKSKLGHDKLNLHFEQVLEKSIEEEFPTFAAGNERKKEDIVRNDNLRKNLTEAAKMVICNDIRSEHFDLHKFNLTDRFNHVKQDSMNEFDSKKRGQNEIDNVFRILLDQDLNDFHNSLVTTLEKYIATNNTESHLSGCTNINKKDAEMEMEMEEKNATFGGDVVSERVQTTSSIE